MILLPFLIDRSLGIVVTISVLIVCALQIPSFADVNLVPKQPVTAPSYFCTWSVQNYIYGDGASSIDPGILEGGQGAQLARDSFTEDQVFGAKGWATTFYPKVRGDLYFLIDDGYYLGGMDSMDLDPKKFPTFTGDSTQRLAEFNRALIKLGWRGLALWSRGTPNDPALIQRSKDAGVHYWKIDGGDGDFAIQNTKQISYPGLTLEHVNGEGPFNGDWSKDGRLGTQDWNSRRVEIIKNTDVYRTYDVTAILSIPTTLDRVEQLLSGAQGHPEVKALLNCEDEAYVGAALGCTVGVMRHPLVGLRPSGDPDVFFNGARQAKRRTDEIVRALHWQRIAEPYPAGIGFVNMDTNILTDDWVFQKGQTWDSDVIGKDVKQGAPARFSRNLPLPVVAADGELPFVVAGKFPNGAVGIATFGRVTNGSDWHTPLADITVDVDGAPGPFGVFGHYKSLTLKLGGEPGHVVRFLCQDLAGERSVDITRQVIVNGDSVTLPGSLIDRMGVSAGSLGDLSDPGVVLAIQRR